MYIHVHTYTRTPTHTYLRVLAPPPLVGQRLPGLLHLLRFNTLRGVIGWLVARSDYIHICTCKQRPSTHPSINQPSLAP